MVKPTSHILIGTCDLRRINISKFGMKIFNKFSGKLIVTSGRFDNSGKLKKNNNMRVESNMHFSISGVHF